MPVVRVEQRIAAPAAAIWSLVSDVEAHARLIGHVRSAEVREAGPGYRLIAWEVDVKGCAMGWVERQELDEERFRIDYRLVEGDLAQWEGYWRLEPQAHGMVDVEFSVTFDIGVPALSDMLDPVAERAIRENSLAMLASLAKSTDAAAV